MFAGVLTLHAYQGNYARGLRWLRSSEPACADLVEQVFVVAAVGPGGVCPGADDEGRFGEDLPVPTRRLPHRIPALHHRAATQPMTSTYTYNPACTCQWCHNNGNVPTDSADLGHAFGYENPHFPPSRITFAGANTPNNIVPLPARTDTRKAA